MHTLMIRDLSVNFELDREAMVAVRGGLNGPASALSQDFWPAPWLIYGIPGLKD